MKSNSIQELNAALEAGKYNTAPVLGQALQIQDLSEMAERHLTTSAKLDLKNRTSKLVVREEDGTISICVYISNIVVTGNEENGVREIAKVLNDLSQRGEIRSVLTPPSSIKLASDSSVPKTAVFSFVLVPAEKHDEVNARYAPFTTKEGEIGPAIDDLSVPLSDGEFLAIVHIPHQLLQSQSKTSAELVQREIDNILLVLPKGTRVRQVTALATVSVVQQCEVKFYNALMPQVKRVEVEYRREFAKFEGGIVEYNLLTRVRYFDKDGELYV